MINKNIDFAKTISLHIKNSIDSIKKIESELSNDIISAVKLIIQTFTRLWILT